MGRRRGRRPERHYDNYSSAIVPRASAIVPRDSSPPRSIWPQETSSEVQWYHVWALHKILPGGRVASKPDLLLLTPCRRPPDFQSRLDFHRTPNLELQARNHTDEDQIAGRFVFGIISFVLIVISIYYCFFKP